MARLILLGLFGFNVTVLVVVLAGRWWRRRHPLKGSVRFTAGPPVPK